MMLTTEPSLTIVSSNPITNKGKTRSLMKNRFHRSYCRFHNFVSFTTIAVAFVTPIQSFQFGEITEKQKFLKQPHFPTFLKPTVVPPHHSPSPKQHQQKHQHQQKENILHVANDPTVLANVDVKAAVIVPGFFTGEKDFLPLAESLKKRGIPAVVVPMPAWHWIPCCFGRKSLRPILERLDNTIRHVSACIANDETIKAPKFQYNIFDCYYDCYYNMFGPSVADTFVEDDSHDSNSRRSKTIHLSKFSPHGIFPEPPSTINKKSQKCKKNANPSLNRNCHVDNSEQQGASKPPPRIAVIGHSAGGLISRIFLSNSPYGGKAYHGTEFVHSLITLGTPHGNIYDPANNENVHWCNNKEPSLPVRGLAVGAVGTPGHCSGSLTQDAYTFSTGAKSSSNCQTQRSTTTTTTSATMTTSTITKTEDSTEGAATVVDGDGLITIQSALSLKGDNVQHKVLQGVTHYPWSRAGILGRLVAPDLAKQGKPWYGDDHIVEKWVDFLINY